MYNDVLHQKMDSECGTFCVYFIIEMLEGKTFKEIIKNVIGDKAVNKKRKEYYRKSSEDNPLDIMEFVKDSGLFDELYL